VLAGGSPELTQAIVAAVVKEGHFARHIQRMRKLYAERREATAAGLENVWGKHMRIDSQPGGMHLILRLRGRRSDRRLVARMREEGLYGEALSDWTMGIDGASALLEAPMEARGNDYRHVAQGSEAQRQRSWTDAY
jgi:GntR family transcriptional regulator / MocR family aminotransferase